MPGDQPHVSHLTQIKHPLVEHHLCTVRDRATQPSEFRSVIQRLSVLIGVHATNDLAVEPVVIRTPLADAPCHRLSVRIGLVPILRAGLGIVWTSLGSLVGPDSNEAGSVANGVK